MSATQIVKGVDVLVAIRWLQEEWKEVTNLTIKNCFEKCGIKGDNERMKVEENDDLEFEALVNEFTMDISAAQFRRKCSSVWANEFEIDWWQRVREDSINAIQNSEIESDQVEEISDDDGSNDENDELEQESISFKEIIAMLHKWSDALSLTMIA